jgi:WD repeat-containing protein 35
LNLSSEKPVSKFAFKFNLYRYIAAMEKTRMYIFRGTEPEEPVLSSGYICGFHDLQIKAVLLDEVMKAPEKPNKEHMINFETKSLRDTRSLLSDVSIQDAYQFIEDNSHPRLWRLLAEHCLEKLNLSVADKAFVRCADYHGIQFVKRLQMLDDEVKQRAEVSAYFKKFDEAETLYAEVDRIDLAVEMRMHLGDWFKVEKLIQAGAGDDSTLTLAWNNIGNYFADRQKWQKAVAYYAQAKNVEKLVDCFYALEDYPGLAKLIGMVPEGSQLLCTIGMKFVSVGLCEPAVTAYLRAGDVKAAVDACVLLNQWDQAVELAEQHNFQQIEGLLGKYAGYLLEKEKKIAAIDLYRKANKHNEVASLLTQLAKISAAAKVDPLRVKKLYVLAALEVTKYRQRALNADMSAVTRGVTANGQTAAAQTLDGLMTLDQVASENSAMEGSWRGAEAYHFWLLAHRQLYDGQFEYARRTSLILQDYEDLLDSVDIYSFIAIACYYSRHYGRCSKAFMKLESIPGMAKENRESYSDLATSIFVKHPPTDPASSRSRRNDEVSAVGGSKLILTNICMASGREIGAADNVQACKSCNHRSITGELRGRATCPLCHSLFVKRGGTDDSTPSAVNKSPTAPSYGRGIPWDAM